jgi:hypothetical protein
MITINELFSGIGSQVAALRRIGVPHNVVDVLAFIFRNLFNANRN